MPVKVWIDGELTWLNVTPKTKSHLINGTISSLKVDENFYITSKKKF
jgi:hypothetical protein